MHISKKEPTEATHYAEDAGEKGEYGARRRSSVADITHSEAPIWEQRQTYGKQGFMGIFTSKYVFLCAAFATMGGLLFGYE
jgi:hypothetical protein